MLSTRGQADNLHCLTDESQAEGRHAVRAAVRYDAPLPLVVPRHHLAPEHLERMGLRLVQERQRRHRVPRAVPVELSVRAWRSRLGWGGLRSSAPRCSGAKLQKRQGVQVESNVYILLTQTNFGKREVLSSQGRACTALTSGKACCARHCERARGKHGETREVSDQRVGDASSELKPALETGGS